MLLRFDCKSYLLGASLNCANGHPHFVPGRYKKMLCMFHNLDTTYDSSDILSVLSLNAHNVCYYNTAEYSMNRVRLQSIVLYHYNREQDLVFSGVASSPRKSYRSTHRAFDTLRMFKNVRCVECFCTKE